MKIDADGFSFDFTDAINAFVFDEKDNSKPAYHGLPMKAVDIVAEFNDAYVFVEMKDFHDPDIYREILAGDEEDCKAKRANFKWLKNVLKYKYRDTYIFRHAEGKVEKPIHYICLLTFDNALNNRLQKAREAADQYGYNALHWALRAAFNDPKFAAGPFAALYERLAPPNIDVSTGERLVRIDRHLSEYFLFQTMWTLFKSRFTHEQRRDYGAFETQDIINAWQHLPANVIRPERNKRQHISSVLSRNEVERDYAYNRALFMRVAQGWYQFNPRLSVRRRQGEEEQWIPLLGALNLPLVSEFAWGDGYDNLRGRLNQYLLMAGLPEQATPITAERAFARYEAAEMARLQREVEERAAQERRIAELEALRQSKLFDEPKWGTPAAKRREVERVRREIEVKKKN